MAISAGFSTVLVRLLTAGEAPLAGRAPGARGAIIVKVSQYGPWVSQYGPCLFQHRISMHSDHDCKMVAEK